MVAMLLGSCNKQAFERADEVEDGGLKKEVRFSCAAASGTENGDAKVATKVTGTSFDEGEVIGIYAYPSGESIFGAGEDVRGNVPYKALGGGQKGQLAVVQENGGGEVKPIYFPTDKSKWLNFRGYYPYSQNMSAEGKLMVNVADQSRGQEGAILYSDNQNGVATTADFIRLEFEYVMAQVVVNLKYDPVSMAGELVERNVTGVALEGTGLRTTCTFEVETGKITADVEGESVAGRIVMKPGVATTQATVVPGTGVLNDLVITVATRAGRTYVAKPSPVTFVAGRQYIYNVTLKGGGEAEIVGNGEATVLPWEMGNNADLLPPIVGEQEN